MNLPHAEPFWVLMTGLDPRFHIVVEPSKLNTRNLDMVRS